MPNLEPAILMKVKELLGLVSADSETVVESGGQERVAVSDSKSQQLLLDVLKELKKMNVYMSLLTDTDVDEMDTKG